MDPTSYLFALSVLQIVWIDVLLSGDNAVVIALACRSLPPKQRLIGISLGVVVALALRIVFAVAVSYLLAIPFLKVAGGLMLLWIAVKLVVGEDDDAAGQTEATTLMRAVGTIAVADAVMSLDNVVAVAAASHGHNILFVFGLILSMPLMIGGASLITSLIARYPLIVWAGGALLGWIAGDMLATDPFVANALHAAAPNGTEIIVKLICVFAAASVLAIGGFMSRNRNVAGHA